MNDVSLPPEARVAVTPARPGLPLDAIVWTVRAVEFGVVIASGLIAIWLFLDAELPERLASYRRIVAMSALAFAVLAETVGCYDLDAQFSLRRAWQRVLTSWVATALFMLTLGFLLKASDQISRGWVLGWLALGGGSLLATRGAMTIWVRRMKTRGAFDQRVAIFGAGAQGARLAHYIQTHDKLTISLVGFYDDRRDGRVPTIAAGLPVLGNLAALVARIRGGDVDQVIVALPWSADVRLQEIVSQLALTPVRIRLAPDLASFAFASRPVVLLGEMPVMTLFERPISGLDAWAKIAEDRVLGGIALLLVSPLLLLIAVAIRLDSPGPILFRQPREGFNNRPFHVFKFRSMFHGHAELDNIRQARRGDPRVTRVGRVLRALSLDELPQLFNVMQGTMSLVGPRPHAASTRAGGKLFSDVVQSYAARHKVKPGITGWAQVCGWRGETDTEDKLVKRFEHDLFYIENWTIWFDIYIMMRTLVVLVAPRNAF